MTFFHPLNLERRCGQSSSVCVSIFGRSIADLKRSASEALTFHPGFLELRLDYLGAAGQSLAELPNTDENTNKILTFRSQNEGGVSRVSDRTRKHILLEVISANPRSLIDVEINTLKSSPEILNALRNSSLESKLIASSHNFRRIEKESELESLVIAAAHRFSPSIVKVVRQANEFSDNLRILSLYKLAQEISPTKLVAFCSGPLGIFSRIACVSYGSPFTFASLPNRKTAPGQLDVQTMTVLLDSWGVNQK